MVPGIDPKVDYAFKLLFGSEAHVPLLLNLLNAVLNMPAHRKIVFLTILNPFNDKEDLDDKLSILDIKARDEQGRQYNIEMQMVGMGSHLHRMLYYWSVLHSGQLHEGSDYGELRETISICFVNSVLFPQVPDHHLVFQLQCSQHPQLIYSEHLRMHLVELPKFKRGPLELANALDVWCYFLVHADMLDANDLPESLRIPAVQRAMEVLQMITQNDAERERYEARLKERRDRNMFAQEAEKREQEGLARGRVEGRVEGQTLGYIRQIHLCQRLLKIPPTPQEQLLALSLPELQTLAESLERQLGASGA
jgi:predicted transposase/invertase (TIGR01784 family)